MFHEPFRQWVLEDAFVKGTAPDLRATGVTLVPDVSPFEHMKLRMLNGTHSALAYMGWLCGFETVAEAVADPELRAFVTRLWRDEISVSFNGPQGVDIAEYAAALLERYDNPAIQHRAIQIAMDGTQKLPQRILSALFETRRAHRTYEELLSVVVEWIAFVAVRSKTHALDDPMATELADVVASAEDTNTLISGMLQLGTVFEYYPADEIAKELGPRAEDGLERGALR